MAKIKILHLKVTSAGRCETAMDIMFNPSECKPTIAAMIRGKSEGLGCHYQAVAKIDADNLDDAFVKTQNIDTAWKAPNRSSMVGDVFVTEDGKYHVVDRFGFFELEV